MTEKTDSRPPIKGGYCLQPRSLFEHELWREKPLLYRCLWHYLYSMANHADTPTCSRGQILTSIPELQNVLSYKEGYRTRKPTKDKIWRAIEYFRGQAMITTAATTRGMFITICNYEFYQDPTNYGRDAERDNGATTARRSRDTIHKNGKNGKNETAEHSTIPSALNTSDFVSAWFEWQKYRKELKKKLTPSTQKRQLNKLAKYPPEVAIEAINRSIEKGWQGLFPESINQNEVNTANKNDPDDGFVH